MLSTLILYKMLANIISENVDYNDDNDHDNDDARSTLEDLSRAQEGPD